jgi:hypothetical protein
VALVEETRVFTRMQQCIFLCSQNVDEALEYTEAFSNTYTSSLLYWQRSKPGAFFSDILLRNVFTLFKNIASFPFRDMFCYACTAKQK